MNHRSALFEPGQLDERTELRSETLRVADLAPFPREGSPSGPRTGFALDESESGMCLQLESAVPTGALLRVTLRDFDGRVTREVIVRVVWCRPRDRGRYNAGLEVVNDEDGELLCARHAATADGRGPRDRRGDSTESRDATESTD